MTNPAATAGRNSHRLQNSQVDAKSKQYLIPRDEAEELVFSMIEYDVRKLRTLDDELSDALYELDPAMKSPWPDDLMPSVQEFLGVFREYRCRVNPSKGTPWKIKENDR